MIKKKFLIGLFCISAYISCMPEENLPLRDMGDVSDYFIECYCQPEQNIILTATKVVPITGNMQYNFPPEMDVTIRTPERIRMYYVFSHASSDVMCNYQSAEKLETKDIDTLFLDITTANKTKITASTPIPYNVYITDYKIENNLASIRFYTSDQSQQNYYIYTLEIKNGGSITTKESVYLDYSHYQTTSLVEKTIVCNDLPGAEEVKLILKRITKANYHYQISQNAASTAVQGSITNPVPLKGNLHGALGIFTCYTEDQKIITRY